MSDLFNHFLFCQIYVDYPSYVQACKVSQYVYHTSPTPDPQKFNFYKSHLVVNCDIFEEKTLL